jgi:creatinine amidohydrolase
MTIVDWAALKATDFPSRIDERTLAVLPVGAVEQHGPHLPVGTDSTILAGLLDALRGRELTAGNAVLLPLLPVGSSVEHKAFAGTLTVEAETLLALWCDVARSAARAGVRRLLFLNSHGGNSALCDVAAFRLRDELGLLAAALTTHRLGAPEGLLTAEEQRYGIHGGHAETALVQAIAPAQVATAPPPFDSSDRRLASPRTAFSGGVARVAWHAEDLNPAGTVGDASKADPESGRDLMTFLADRTVAVMEDLLTWPLPDAVSR